MPKDEGGEGTISQGTRTFGLRRCRYRGEAKTGLQNIITASSYQSGSGLGLVVVELEFRNCPFKICCISS